MNCGANFQEVLSVTGYIDLTGGKREQNETRWRKATGLDWCDICNSGNTQVRDARKENSAEYSNGARVRCLQCGNTGEIIADKESDIWLEWHYDCEGCMQREQHITKLYKRIRRLENKLKRRSDATDLNA